MNCSPPGSSVKLFPESTFSGERNGNPLQYSCLENPLDRGAWQATVHGVKDSDTTERLTHTHTHTHTHTCPWNSTHTHTHTLLCPWNSPDTHTYTLSSVYGILQERILAWVTISFSRGSSRSDGKECRWILYDLRQQGSP